MMGQYDRLMDASWQDDDTNQDIARPYHIVRGFFTDIQVDSILSYMTTQQSVEGLVGKPSIDQDYSFAPDHDLRKCSVTYIQQDDHNQWFLQAIEQLITDSNDSLWQFDIADYSQPARMMSYDSTDHFNSWHMDAGPGATRYRKLTAIVMLSDVGDFTGGNFQIACYGTIPLNKGDIVIFPAFTMHRVTPVITGSRRTLVHRAIGARFK